MDIDTLLLECKMTDEEAFKRMEGIMSTAKRYTVRMADGVPSLVFLAQNGKWFVFETSHLRTVDAVVSGNDVEKGQFIYASPFRLYIFVPDLYDSSYNRHFHESSQGFDFVEVLPVAPLKDDHGFFKHTVEPDIVGTDDEKRIYVRVFEDNGETFICKCCAKWIKISKREYYHLVFDSPVRYIESTVNKGKNDGSYFEFDNRDNAL